MDINEVNNLTAKGESETLELKRSTGGRKEAAATICAMLNRSGGTVLFGVEPTGKVIGQVIGEQTIEQLVNEVDGITPKARPTVERISLDESREVIAITVRSGKLQPYRYKGVAYLRVGNTNRKMTDAEADQIVLERLHKTDRWELVKLNDWSLDDLDLTEIVKTVSLAVDRGRLNELNNLEPASILRGLGLFEEGKLNRAAAALFGNPERLLPEFPQCALRVARFRGNDKSVVADNRKFTGNLLYLFERAMQFFGESNPIAGEVPINSFFRVDKPQYPPAAVREALANAFCHRDYIPSYGAVWLAIYDDRLEVSSNGALHFGLSPEDLFVVHESKPWNPLIANVFYLRGVIEQWGMGTLNMLKAVVDAGLPRPVIEEIDGSVRVQFFRDLSASVQPSNGAVDRTMQDVVRLLRSAPNGLALSDILARIPTLVSKSHLRKALNKLRREGKIEQFGRGVAARWHYAKNIVDGSES